MRSRVRLRVKVTDSKGKPVSGAHLGVTVVDEKQDSVSLSAGWLAQRYLNSSELTGLVYKPNFYFRWDEPNAALGLELVMGTHGWRGFSWKKVWSGRSPVAALTVEAKKRRHWRSIAATTSNEFAHLSRPWASQWKKVRETQKKNDLDGDGVPNVYDRCARTFGFWKRWGCPLGDKDKDGIPDEADVCPQVRGLLQYEGCPSPLMVEKKPNRMGIFHKVFFAPGLVVPRKQDKPVLLKIASLMKQFPELTIQLEGYTDKKENSRKAKTLGLERAEYVRKFLVKQGIGAPRLRVKGYAGKHPSVKEPDSRSQYKNRRVEFRVTTWLSRPWWWSVATTRVFPVKFFGSRNRNLRDRRSTVYWNPHWVTDAKGVARTSFYLSSNLSTFQADLHSFPKSNSLNCHRELLQASLQNCL